MKKIGCTDYDSMENHGRFPKPKDIKPSLIGKFLNSINKVFYDKRR